MDWSGVISSMCDDEVARLLAQSDNALSGVSFVPFRGTQSRAYFSEADVLLFGGKVGGGKSALLNGLALQEHYRSLLCRSTHTALRPLIDVGKELVGESKGFVGGGRPLYNKPDGGVIHYMGLINDGGAGSLQGEAHDFIGIDEAAQIPEDYVRTVMGWLRPTTRTKSGQRLRVVLGSNPPLDSTGDWMLDFFPCWLDDTYPNPAEDGELRWFIRDGSFDVECKEGDSVILDGVEVFAHSRTFIASDFNDNPYVDSADYARTMGNLDETSRKILMGGNFMVSRGDSDNQMIPTDWIRAAQSRWDDNNRPDSGMLAMGVDVTGGGGDMSVISTVYDGLWFDQLISEHAGELPLASDQAAWVVKNRRGMCNVGIDFGGGFGGGTYSYLVGQGIPCLKYVGASPTKERTADRSYGFANVRAMTYWRLREMLDPDQEGGAVIALPPSKKLLSDLATPTYEKVMDRGRLVIKMECKKSIKKRIRRSTDEGDAIVMALWVYMKGLRHGDIVPKNKAGMMRGAGAGFLGANFGYAHRKKRRK